MRDLIDALPKAELHLHIEGSFEPELMFEIARRNRVAIPFASVEEVRAAYRFGNLQDFLDIYYQGMNVLREPEDYRELAGAYLARARADNLRHVEMFFDPQAHTGRGVPLAVVVDGLRAAAAEAAASGGPSVYLIPCFLRHLSEAEALETLDALDPMAGHFVGVGLDSSERGHPPSKFARAFARAREMGFKLCAHAGEEGPPAYIREALDILKVDRIDHGNSAIGDERLLGELAARGITLTNCPLSNLRLGGIASLAESPVQAMLERGIRVTVNSDDPAYFGGYVNDNFEALAGAQSLGATELGDLARNSFAGSFLPDDEKARHIAAVDRALADFTGRHRL
ncbi:adenosine deaminase [Oceanibacterium hippocampi]|uniref:Adenine deaminase n=1 Tax=Oceanibacterium hippocampi TaxID=745714 RepID=A0A1Y5TXA0_9PROT|nr:adenosine deaminase [Oceanibacterium hippocampi]SLN76039.1 Adenine deaminase [Oceanibacterium hippocampi]